MITIKLARNIQGVRKCTKKNVVPVALLNQFLFLVLFDYLNEPSNSLPRAGAIALGGASGFILGLRHGFIRRVLYTGIGTAALASICYPKDAEIYAQKALVEGKAAAKIAYNFAYGGKL